MRTAVAPSPLERWRRRLGRRLPLVAGAMLLVAVGLAVACSSARPRRPPALPPSPPATPAEPTPPAAEVVTPAPVVAAPPLPLVEPPVATALPASIRVGLRSDLGSYELACCAGVVRDGEGRELGSAARGVRVRPGVAAGAANVYRLQAAALREQSSADALARRLTERTGLAADARFDAGTGLYRVRMGRFATREEAERSQRRLDGQGLSGTWIVEDGPGLERPRLLVELEGRRREVAGRWLVIEPATDPGLAVDGVRYRGRLLLYLTDRATLNLVNELSLEDYLRGVVPEELGPGIYPQLEALKAQAVAARTYTVRNLGDFVGEGFDICATPRCQVYGGMAVEHPLSDRAVAETAGQVLLAAGRPIDALYTAVCGGHTEDAGTVFPLKASESYLSGVPCVEAGAIELAGGVVGAALPAAELVEDLTVVALRGREVRVRGRGGERAGTLPADLLLFRDVDGQSPGSRREVTVAPGDPIRLLWSGSTLRALVTVARAVPFEVPAYVRKYLRWSRFRSDAELATTVRARYPGFALADLEVLTRGVSGRVARLRLTDATRRELFVEGLEVRWTLDLPDTLFELRRTSDGGKTGWRFDGRGWGHGVGMCQVGSYGLARRGASYRDVLAHYYKGAELVTLPAAETAVATRSPAAALPAPVL